eukprot:CAMPEP_0181409812 /NCGR_PEP_ID=MMETSP1110-20121109/7016_1 /TAXON_ID=174948 /ORGANISM="Symbiodinium sp., Strain CCMP421" /LENGTH=1887 /DNA_ID=CAMNT_0023532339 /DNA_START=33 /DNA_END=5696 /DNA_ORIENTATION=-
MGAGGSARMHFVMIWIAVLFALATAETRTYRNDQAGASGARRLGALEDKLAHTMHVVKELKAAELELTKEYLLLAFGSEDSSKVKSLSASTQQQVAVLVTGNDEFVAPPNSDTAAKLNELIVKELAFHSLLLSSLYVNTSSVDLLAQVVTQKEDLEDAYDKLHEQYGAYGQMNGYADPMQKAYGFHLQADAEGMAVKSLLILLDLDRSNYLTLLQQAQVRFSAMLQSLRWGDVVLQIPDLTDVCMLQALAKVSASWFELDILLLQVRSDDAIGVDLSFARSVQSASAVLRSDLHLLGVAFETNMPCNPLSSMEEALWKTGIMETNLFRSFVQKSARLFFQVISTAAADLEKLLLTQTLADASAAIGNALKGSYSKKVPVPPSQALVDLLTTSFALWTSFQEDVQRAVVTGDAAVTWRVGRKSDELDAKLEEVGLGYVLAAYSADPTLRAIVWESAEQNRGLLQQLAEESLLISLRDSAVGMTGSFEAHTAKFEKLHWELLRGATNSHLVPEVPIPRTVDACTLTTMATVWADYEALKSILIQLYGSKDFLTNHKGFIASEAASPVLAQAMLAFKQGWDEFRNTDEKRLENLQIAYIYSNPNAVGSKDNLDFAPGSEYYHQVHAQYHPVYRSILYERNYYDIFMFDLEGNLIYSVYKELDYATNFAANGTGVWKDSGLGEAFRAAMANPDLINVIDWKPYGPSYGALASFLSTGIKQDGQLVGVFCTQMPPESKPVQISEMEPVLDTALASMDTAVRFYLQGNASCDTALDATSWEVMMQTYNSLDSKFKHAETEFALLAAGYSQEWLSLSAVGLEEHKSYLVIEAAKPGLVDALWEFKQAWDAYRPTNAERLLSLQIAYILLNPNPLGQKDVLDYADGPEDYHQVHRRYHPTYRTILYDRNYYDIFMFDLEGNLIYSVFKELDYATNFLADGIGEWKDSGLGEAFRAAVANPDGINIIDWKPYGPSYGALASFLSTGVRRYGELIGVFSTQLPPEFTPRNSSALLDEVLEELHATFEDFKFGSPAAKAKPPPSQAAADHLFAASDAWDTLEAQMKGPKAKEVLLDMRNKGESFKSVVLELEHEVQSLAYQQQPTILGEKMRLASETQSMLQQIQLDSVLISMGGFDSLRGSLGATSAKFEQNQVLLRDGNLYRRLAMTDVPATNSFDGLEKLTAMDSAWVALKPEVEAIAMGGETSVTTMKTFVPLADTATEAAAGVSDFFSTVTRTTTLMALEILAPMPLTGDWAAGQTFRLAARLAEGIINQDQLILPGYRLQHQIYDDKCDDSVGSDKVVSAMATIDTFVAIGGMGCDAVCRQVSSLATSMRLPFLSYECPSAAFSDLLAFPALARMGTSARSRALTVIEQLKEKYTWKHVYVVSADPAQYQVESEAYVADFQAMGVSSEYLSAPVSRWNDIRSVMATIKGQTPGLDRVIFVVGPETFYRKLICASIIEGLQKGVTWLSKGTWRNQWWQRSDLLTSAHRQWLREDVGGLQLKTVFTEFKNAWDSFRGDVETTRQDLFALYVTDLKDELQEAEGTERYHEVHAQYHPIYRRILYERGYYDIFIFDLEGNLIYSVFKETDYATNFAADGNGPWKDSGLGQAFRGALERPDNLTYVDWQPYGPSAYADAAFFSTGLRNEDGVLIGIYSIQLPPEYERSIEVLQPQCSFTAIQEAFQGSINVAGLGRPIEANMEKPLPCFKGYSPRSLLSLLDLRFKTGYPIGDPTTIVEDPYYEVKAHAVDATCAFAFGLQYLFRQGHTVEQIQQRDPAVYRKFTDYIQLELDFQGASGRVKFNGNDKDNLLMVQQLVGENYVEAGLVAINGTVMWEGNGTTAEFWQVEPAETFELMWILHPIALSLAIGCPCCFGCWVGYRIKAALSTQNTQQSSI